MQSAILRPHFLFLFVLVIIFGAQSVHASNWRSTLYPEDWTPEFSDAEGRFLHDFSYAGYHAGEKPLPKTVPGPRVDVTEPPYYADNTGVQSATRAIQQALNDVGRAGGGTVYLPEGTYRITFDIPGLQTALLMTYSHVVLQGAGVDKTFLFLDEKVTRGKSMINVQSVLTGMSWGSPKDGDVRMIREDAEARDTRIALVDVSGLSVGDAVVVQYDLTPDWVAAHNMTGGWDSSIAGPQFYRQIVAIDADDDTIVLDVPLRYDVKQRDNGRVYRVNDPLREVGLADFSLGMREHPATSGWGNNDHGIVGTGAYDVHAGRAVSFTGVVDSWIRDVATYKPEGNTYAHIHSIGFAFSQSRFLTIRRVSVENPQYLGGGGNGYPFVVGTQESLYDDLRAMNGRHNFTITGQRASGNVIYRGYISNPIGSLAADFHAYLSMANLIDNLTIDHDRFEAADRSHAAGVSGFPKHGVSTTHSVFWNNEGLAYAKDMPAIIRSDQYGWGYVIGTRGPAPIVRLGSNAATAPEDFLEGEGEGAFLTPQSLYYDQLRTRLEREGKTTAWDTVKGELHPPEITDRQSLVETPSARKFEFVALPAIHMQDFEVDVDGELPIGWTPLASPNSPDMPRVVPVPDEVGAPSGQHALLLDRTAGTSNVTGQAVLTFEPVTERLRVSFHMHTLTDRRNLRIILGGSELPPASVHGTTANSGIFLAMNGGRVQALADAASNTWIHAGSYLPNRWHKVTLEIDIRAQTLDVFLDDSMVAENEEPIPFYRAYSDLNTIGFSYQSISSHNNTVPVYVDDVSIQGR